jgi:hypothetical protein
MRAIAHAVVVGLAAAAVSACARAGHAAVNAAAQDPMKCERDPSCSRARASYVDCTRQCVDDPECMRLCEDVQQQTDSLGH